MKASPQMQSRLLDLQELDTKIAQLEHRMKTLPELTDIARLEAEQTPLRADMVRTETALGDLERDVTKAEQAVQQVRDRAARDEARLASGTGSAKDLQGLQHELESLARRQGVLEDEQLEVMERVEAAQAEAETAAKALADNESLLSELRSSRDEQLAATGAERDEVASGRDAITADLSPELVALYDRVRQQTGMGAAPLLQRRCGGCRLELNAVDLSRFRSADEDAVLRCEECGRVLVRTAESGL